MCLLFFRLTNVQSADGSAAASFLGTGHEAGADEDDFHMIRRRNLEIDGDEREDAGVHQGKPPALARDNSIRLMKTGG